MLFMDLPNELILRVAHGIETSAYYVKQGTREELKSWQATRVPPLNMVTFSLLSCFLCVRYQREAGMLVVKQRNSGAAGFHPGCFRYRRPEYLIGLPYETKSEYDNKESRHMTGL